MLNHVGSLLICRCAALRSCISVHTIDFSIHDVELVVEPDVALESVSDGFLEVVVEDFLSELVRKVEYKAFESGMGTFW
jgi:hypothetical protein